MAESTVRFLLNQLSTWLTEERNLLGGLRDQVLIIHGELQQMTAFLRVVDAKEETDPQLKEWVRQVRQIAYEIRDVLETYILRCGSGNGGYVKKIYASIKHLKAKQKVASEIKSLKLRAESASKTFRDMYGVLLGSSSDAVAGNTWYDGRGDALRLEESDVVGIEGSRKQLLAWVSSVDYSLKVISVVGMAGLGKTTLVKKVYDHPSVKENIDHHAWITVSKMYEVEDLLKNIIKQLLQEMKQEPPLGLETMNVDAMREFIYNFLQNKKYLMVLDDVWTTNVWEALRYIFPKRSTHGRGCIIITTRLNSVGDFACCESGDHVYRLQPLPPQKARELFHTKAFPSGTCPDHLKENFENILKRCGGLPLAIVVIGGLLATKRNAVEEWTKFSIGVESEIDDDPLKRMWKLLSLSYYDLPYYLKACFLYLSIFPEDVLIEKSTIIRLWIAEGFVEAKQGKTMEEIAKGYLNELSNRNLIQVAKTSICEKPRDFCIHDLLREYIISKAREQNIFSIRSQAEITPDRGIRRLALDDSFINSNEKSYNFKSLHTLLFFGLVKLKWGSTVCKVLCDDCRMLTVLDLKGAPLDKIPNEVFKLFHLKYLSFRNTNVSLIPKLVGNLKKLEILDLKGSRVTYLPIEIIKLRRLQYILVYRYKFLYGYRPFHNVQSFEAPYEIGQLLLLQKLSYIDASANIVREIGRLTKLRRLGITKLRKENGKELCSSLANLTYLSSLSITALDEDEVIDLQFSMPPTCLQFLCTLKLSGHLEKLPLWMCSLKALTYLALGWSRIDEDPLESLQGLPTLKILIMDGAYEGEGLSSKSGGFQKLKKLYVHRMDRLMWVRLEKRSMPSLDTFEMVDCKAMMELPMGIEHLANLHDVLFVDMSEEFAEKFFEEKRGEGNHWKLAHIPKIHILNLVDGEVKVRRL